MSYKVLFAALTVSTALAASGAGATGLKLGGTNNYGGDGGNAAAIAGAAASASAGAAASVKNWNSNAQGQFQGQGQDQSQSASASSGVTGSGNSTNDNRVSNKIEGDEGSVGVALGVADCGVGFNVGVPGIGAIGLSQTDTQCKVLREAAFLASIGRTDLAITHLSHLDRFKDTMRYHGAEPVTPSTSSKSPAVRPEPRPATAYAKCEMDGDALRVRPKFGADRDLAVSQCRALHGL